MRRCSIWSGRRRKVSTIWCSAWKCSSRYAIPRPCSPGFAACSHPTANWCSRLPNEFHLARRCSILFGRSDLGEPSDSHLKFFTPARARELARACGFDVRERVYTSIVPPHLGPLSASGPRGRRAWPAGVSLSTILFLRKATLDHHAARLREGRNLLRAVPDSLPGGGPTQESREGAAHPRSPLWRTAFAPAGCGRGRLHLPHDRAVRGAHRHHGGARSRPRGAAARPATRRPHQSSISVR